MEKIVMLSELFFWLFMLGLAAVLALTVIWFFVGLMVNFCKIYCAPKKQQNGLYDGEL